MSNFSFSDWSQFLDQWGASSSSSSSNANRMPEKITPTATSVEKLIKDIENPLTREHALFLLSRNRGIRADLAPLLWNSSGTIYLLLQEITSAYRILSSPELVARATNNVCNALALLQCVASNPNTRMNLIQANIPCYLYPFLGVKNKEKPYEYLRLTSLGVIGALVKVDNAEIVHFLLQSEIVPLCLRCMEVGNELSKTVATFIIQKILVQDEGLRYFCSFAERFFALARVMGTMVDNLVEEPSQRLLKHIIHCYVRLSGCPRACDGFKICLPIRLRDAAILNLVRDDPIALEWLRQLFFNIATGNRVSSSAIGETLGSLLAS
ncbi:uncharacterized protein LOC100267046 [Vitis vinifera]|uniref:uncharacterized protein LOC100267046 n=1 Tax=Vitis vinifera TaxID=29760 RepID=UPI00019846BD|nr:uncharacterized protein LOC100267046 [Vitis vinifera]|eukprot:XP_002270523.1 PREDICTED: cell differentiation protein RCD1 homolog isoform X1 [Vitis vinifera]